MLIDNRNARFSGRLPIKAENLQRKRTERIGMITLPSRWSIQSRKLAGVEEDAGGR